jgi:hypothetical protein
MSEAHPGTRTIVERKMNHVTVIDCSPSFWEVFTFKKPRPKKCPQHPSFSKWVKWAQKTNITTALANLLIERNDGERVEVFIDINRWAGPDEYTSHPKFLQLRDAGAGGGCIEIIYKEWNLYIGFNNNGTKLLFVE